MRRLKRGILRHRAEQKGVKPSRYVAAAWHKLQVAKVGEAMRKRNKEHGTKPKRRWKPA